MKKTLKKGFTLDVVLAIIVCALPLLWLIWRAFNADLGANPIEALIRQLGVWGLNLLVAGLALSPLAKLLNWPRLNRLRRPVGLMAFFFVCLHLLSYLALDQFFDWNAILKDILKRPFITIGMVGFILLIPLAVTSFNAMIRTLGGRVWKNIHRLIYLIVALGVAHYYLMLKADKTQAIIYGLIVATLLLVRFIPSSNRLKL